MSIEKKYSEEEIRSIVDEAKAKLGMNRELSTDELESVSGGVGPEDALRHEYPLPMLRTSVGFSAAFGSSTTGGLFTLVNEASFPHSGCIELIAGI